MSPAVMSELKEVDIPQMQLDVERSRVPRHIAIILDGNRRWARAKQLDEVSDGHRIGFGKIPDVASWCDSFGIKHLTLWMLSTDNVRKRAQEELRALYEIDEDVVNKLVAAGRYKITFIGSPDLLPERLVSVLRAAERAAHPVGALQINLAIAYGGRDDLLSAVQSVVNEAVETGDRSVTEERISSYLSTSGQPDPDLVVRTSGECRMSGFLLWQAAHAELYFCACEWPDFSKAELLRALHSYVTRERRYGA